MTTRWTAVWSGFRLKKLYEAVQPHPRRSSIPSDLMHPNLCRRARRFPIMFFVTSILFAPNGVLGADLFDDWRDGDLVAQDRAGSREASLWSATRSPYNHIAIVRLTGGGPYVLDLGTTASEMPIEDYIAKGTRSRFAVYRVLSLSHHLRVRAAEAAWNDSDRERDDFLVSDPARLSDTELAHRAFKAVGINLGRSQEIRTLRVTPLRLRDIFMQGWRKNPICIHLEERPDACWHVVGAKLVKPMSSVLNSHDVSKIYQSP